MARQKQIICDHTGATREINDLEDLPAGWIEATIEMGNDVKNTPPLLFERLTFVSWEALGEFAMKQQRMKDAGHRPGLKTA